MNLIIIILLLAIMTSLAFGAYYLHSDRSNSKRTLNALRLRVGLSIVLILTLLAAHYGGFLKGNIASNQVAPQATSQP